MSQLDVANKRRFNIKDSLAKIFNYAQSCKDVESSQLNYDQLQVRIRRVEELLSEFLEVENLINELNINDENQQDDFEDTYFTTVADLNRLIHRANLVSENTSFELSNTQGEQSKRYSSKTESEPKLFPKTFTNAMMSCSICQKDCHPLFTCPKFKEWTVEKRRELVKTEHRCFICFGESHTINQCNSTERCHYCRGRHHSLLHQSTDAISSTSNQALPGLIVTNTPSLADTQPQISSCLQSSNMMYTAASPNATVRMQDISNQSQLCRVLLESSFTTEALIQKLGLKRTHEKISIQAKSIASQNLVTTQRIVRVVVSPHLEIVFAAQISAYVGSIIKVNPVRECVSSLTPADVSPKSISKIDLPIGADDIFDILKPEQIKDHNNQIYARNTHRGWMLTGKISYAQQSSQSNTIIVHMSDNTLKSFWESEEGFESIPLLPLHQTCEEPFKTTTTKLEDQHYKMKLPFKPDSNPLKESKRYVEFMTGYRKRGHMEEMDPPKHILDHLYLPHHGVWKENSTTTKSVSHIMRQSRFNLRKWSSNPNEVLAKMNVAESFPSHPKIISEDLIEIKVLGLQWQPTEDKFTYHVIFEGSTPITKRATLSEACWIFDLLGLLSPYIVKIKSFSQILWLLDVQWDDKLPVIIQNQWQTIRDQANEISTLAVPRWLLMTNGEEHQLQEFCDSSEMTFAATVYLCTYYNDSYVTNLIAARTKVAPFEEISSPRLELNEGLCIPDFQLFGWIDPTIVLDWVSKPPCKYKPYVANRTSQPLEIIPRRKWRHIASKLNQSDCATKGLSPKELKSYTLWWNGPAFLNQETNYWPNIRETETANQPERRDTVQVMTTTCLDESNSLIKELCNTYSSYDKVIRMLIIIRKFYYLCRKKKTQLNNQTQYDWQAAETEILRYSQLQAYQEEIREVNKGNAVSSKSAIKSLSPFVDKRGILRVDGRIDKSIAPYDTRHPIILCVDSDVTKLISEKYHQMYLHTGASELLRLIRRKYWMIQGRNLIKSIIRKSVYCIILRPQTKSHSEKAYICLIICPSTKGVHLLLVNKLSTDPFLSALHRFFARRGISTDVFSDIGINFQAASRKLKEIHTHLNNNVQLISNFIFQRYQVAWHFIPPSVPYFGGICEASAKSAKSQLTKLIGDKILTHEKLLVQIEGFLKSRPLCILSEDEMNPLTPAHFLNGHPITTLPQPDLAQVPYNRLSHYNAIIRSSQLFCKRWHQKCFTSMQGLTKWHTTNEDIQINDKVLVRDENFLINHWKMGIVTQVFPGSDERVRVAEIKINQSTIRRSSTKLCRLPVN